MVDYRSIDLKDKDELKGYEYETLMNALHVSVFKCLLDEDFTAIWCNNYFFDSTGYTKEEYIATYHYSIRNYFSGMADEYTQIAEIVMDALRRGLPGFECVSRMPRKDGSFIWIKVVGTFTQERYEGIPVLYVVYTDITDVIAQQELSRRLEERSQMLRIALDEAERANHAKSDFLSRMSHDMRTPLNAIIGMTEIADVCLDNAEKVHDCHKKIALAGRHLLGLINDVLDMSRIESGNMTLHNSALSLTELIRSVSAMMQPEFEKRKQTFTICSGIIRAENIYSDELRLRQIFLNILSNASKFTPEGGRITFEIKELESLAEEIVWVQFSFSDTGIGMKPEFLEHIFDTFTREQDSRVDKTQGSGLGMAITKKIVGIMGGEISVSSVPGKGSTFVVTLPFKTAVMPGTVNQAEKLPGIKKETSFDFTGRRFLLAEDNELNREIAIELLSATGAFIDAVSDGLACVEAFARSPADYYDVILMDIQMPVMNGYTAAQNIRALERRDAGEVQIWAMTADAFAEDIEKAGAAGMNGHFAKPLDIAFINAELDRVLGKSFERSAKRI